MVTVGIGIAGGGGTVALIGAGMRAIGGDYQNVVVRGINRYVGGRLPATKEIRSSSGREANKQGTNPENQIPACR
jgi:hypothetical protein